MLRISVNHMDRPMGFTMESTVISWLNEDSAAENAVNAHLLIASDPAFENIVFEKEGSLDFLGEAADFPLKPRTRYYVSVTETDNAGVSHSGETWFETGKMNEPWQASLITPQEEDTFHPEFMKRIHLKEKPVNARLYIFGLGLYEAYLNGKRTDDEWLKPYFSDYHREVQAETFDITSLLEEDNTLTVLLGNGWYKGRFGLGGGPVNNYGSRFSLLAELHAQYEDGTEEIIGTDESWQYRRSYIEESDIYDGESQNKEAYLSQENTWKNACLYDLSLSVSDRRSVPVKIYKTLSPVKIIHTPAGETVLDFGQNAAGAIRFEDRFEKGTEITVDFGEILQDGNFFNANYRSAKSRFHYVSGGIRETVSPLFTYFGFRYARITGWPEEIPMDCVRMLCLSSGIEDRLSISSENKMSGRLIRNTWWGMRSNFMDIPTDCPQRDERLGWSGDAMVFSGTALYLADACAFYDHFLHELDEARKEYDGIVPGVIPVQKSGPIYAAIWGDIGTILPMNVYQFTGDREVLRRYYPMMKAWVNRIHADDEARGLRNLWDFGDQLGDWLALDGRTPQSMQGATDPYFIASCYYAYSARLCSEAAAILAQKEDRAYFEKLYDEIRSAVYDTYYTKTGRLAVDTQTGYITALYTGVYPDRDELVRGLKNRLYLDCYKITGGFAGAPLLCRILAENGLKEEARYLLLQEEYPGWMHCVNLGATTIWERWNSVLDDGKLSGTMMNSLNHYAYGSVCEYIFRDICGFTPKEAGFRSARIAPEPSRDFPEMDFRMKTPAGTYEIRWHTEYSQLILKIKVPYNASAEITLPFTGETITVNAGEYTFADSCEEMMRRYTPDTLFRRMKDDPEAMEIIRRNSGFLYRAISGGDEDFLSDTLTSLRKKEFLGFHKEKVDRLEKELTAL